MPRLGPSRRPASSARRHPRHHAPTTQAKVRAAQAAEAPGSEEEAHRAVRLLRRAVHDGVAPEAAREGAEAPEQGGLPRRGDEREVSCVRRLPLRHAQCPTALRREAARLARQAQRRCLRLKMHGPI